MKTPCKFSGLWAVCCALLLGFTSVCAAGPIATFSLTDGRKFSAEILGFADGKFILLHLVEEDIIEVPDAQVASVDFGEKLCENRGGAAVIGPKTAGKTAGGPPADA